MSSSIIRWGIIGTGFIAGEFARGLQAVPQGQLLGIASRKASNAKTFAHIFQVPRHYDSCEELLRDPDIDVVYIGTPNHTHKDLSIMCLKAGKPVLCEKPFAIDASEAREVIEVARRQQLFCMEAMWTRFMPLIQQVKSAVAGGEIGEIRLLTADFSYSVDRSSPNDTPEKGGGVLLDRGIYGLSLAYYLLGTPSAISTQANLSASGTDEQSAVLLSYPQGALGLLSQSVATQGSNRAVISGTKGRIVIDELFIMPEQIAITKFSSSTDNDFPSPLVPRSSKQKLIAKIKRNSLVRKLYIFLTNLRSSNKAIIQPLTGNGYNYEAMEVIRCLQRGELESKIMPLDETLMIIETIDRIRDRWKSSD